jgi:hypothetical protein
MKGDGGELPLISPYPRNPLMPLLAVAALSRKNWRFAPLRIRATVMHEPASGYFMLT